MTTDSENRPAEDIDSDLLDPSRLLPSELRKSWIVIPRATLNRLFIVLPVLCAGVTLGIVGSFVHSSWMECAFPGSFLLVYAVNAVVRWPDEKLLQQLPKTNPEVLTMDLKSAQQKTMDVSIASNIGSVSFALMLGIVALMVGLMNSTSRNALAGGAGVVAFLIGIRGGWRAYRTRRRMTFCASMVAVILGAAGVIVTCFK